MPAEMVDPRTRTYVPPTRVLWQSPDVDATPLLAPSTGQASVNRPPACTLTNGGGVLLDFGRELYGGVAITLGATPDHQPARVRVRFGESATEAMAAPNQDHAVHDAVVPLAWFGTTEVGNTGFRFVRVDAEPDAVVPLQSVRAVSLLRDVPQLGSFECSDDRLNRIWQAGVRTVHLCMQDYLWDGVKRDRLVWVGDLHPEAAVVAAAFGEHPIVPASLDLARDESPLPAWMNGISSYSLWWVLLHRDWYWRWGRLDYLRQQRDYLVGLTEMLVRHVGPGGREGLTGLRFLDWPSSGDAAAVHAGLQSLLVMALTAGAELLDAVGEPVAAARSRDGVVRLRRHVVASPGSKPANALLALAGLFDPKRANELELARDPLVGLSTFYGYYVLQARALAGDVRPCLDVIRTYWGGMLDRGATTFWEDFDLAWLANSGRVDELTPEGRKDLHADFGGYCYVGLRRSLCHGWAAGPTAWLAEHVLGVTPTEPGFRAARVRLNRCDLAWARGVVPTPHGPIRIELTRTPDGTPDVHVVAPREVRVDRG